MNVCKLTGDYYYYKDPIGYGSFSIIYKGYKIADPTYQDIYKMIKRIVIIILILSKYLKV